MAGHPIRQVCQGLTAQKNSVHVSSLEPLVASAGEDGCVYVWDAEHPKAGASYRLHRVRPVLGLSCNAACMPRQFPALHRTAGGQISVRCRPRTGISSIYRAWHPPCLTSSTAGRKNHDTVRSSLADHMQGHTFQLCCSLLLTPGMQSLSPCTCADGPLCRHAACRRRQWGPASPQPRP